MHTTQTTAVFKRSAQLSMRVIFMLALFVGTTAVSASNESGKSITVQLNYAGYTAPALTIPKNYLVSKKTFSRGTSSNLSSKSQKQVMLAFTYPDLGPPPRINKKTKFKEIITLTISATKPKPVKNFWNIGYANRHDSVGDTGFEIEEYKLKPSIQKRRKTKSIRKIYFYPGDSEVGTVVIFCLKGKKEITRCRAMIDYKGHQNIFFTITFLKKLLPEWKEIVKKTNQFAGKLIHK